MGAYIDLLKAAQSGDTAAATVLYWLPRLFLFRRLRLLLPSSTRPARLSYPPQIETPKLQRPI